MNEIFHRTSIRQFEDRKVEPEKVEQLLKAAMQAPTAGNQQAWIFYVIENEEKIEEISKTSPYAGAAANAPLVIVIANKKQGRFPELLDVDAAIATENIWLEADRLGLGAVMMAVAPYEDRMDAVRGVLDIPDDMYAFDIIPIGYPVKVDPQQDRYDENKVIYVR